MRLLLTATLLAACCPAAADSPSRILRFPDLHRDRVVFVHAGDLYTAPLAGGTAFRLTAHEGEELYPKFSPDGTRIAFSAEYNGVFAVDSGGRPATGVSNTYPRGLLLDQTVTRPTGLRMSSDGTLLVYDDDNPARIHRVALDGIEHRLGTFQHLAADLGAAGTIYYDNLGVYQLWELSDGAVAIADTHTSNTPNPRIMVWNADGTFRRQVLKGDSNQHWYAMAATSEDEWLVAMRDGLEGRVVRVDPNTGITQDPPFTDDYSRRLWAVEPWTDGRVVVAGENLITLITDSAGVRLVTDLPSTSATWIAATSFDGKLVVANQHQGEDQNLALISEGGRFERWLRIGSGPVVAPYGVAYLR